ncbi:MAG: hemerythrin domain-containing protein [Candidatus Thiodiazotropha sp. (ex Lucinoma borealis)]|nr:hemerythrin domain-containing protein [Candidatus Thiodiazotropha sp. (ex Lucinoma borealis)]
MENISKPMSLDHRHCDEIFMELEQAVVRGEWHQTEMMAGNFITAMTRHFQIEEQKLFPALEEKTSQADGPVRVMVMEHDQMRHLFNKLNDAIKQQSKETALGITETLLVTMQQHNMKEENILYPLADRFVSNLAEEIAQSFTESA